MLAIFHFVGFIHLLFCAKKCLVPSMNKE